MGLRRIIQTIGALIGLGVSPEKVGDMAEVVAPHAKPKYEGRSRGKGEAPWWKKGRPERDTPVHAANRAAARLVAHATSGVCPKWARKEKRAGRFLVLKGLVKPPEQTASVRPTVRK